ncbi:site-specific DNA-methyltransferase [Brevibacillus laterosporus]|uniref:Methyltransferase n=1 Tax=Brevibacillus laterosporus TaxID=1465 RepID=A0A518VFS3_BRELA|nr:site-specific DNA-methyltransferase [Brevibacillus laterosporus]
MDCLEGMKLIPDKSIDMILCDLPYGQTARNKWDTVIPFKPLWEQYERIIKSNGAIVLFANGMFTADLMASNKKMWRYNLVWDKVLPSGFLNAKKMPLRSHEDLCVFYKKLPLYNPQMVEGDECHSRGKAVGKSQEDFSRNTNYGQFQAVNTKGNLKYPKSILTFKKPHPSTTQHPTQKSVECIEWLIRTYTNEGDIVLDNCIGSGTTAEAAINTKRSFLGFETEYKYIEIANQRIESTYYEIADQKLLNITQ